MNTKTDGIVRRFRRKNMGTIYQCLKRDDRYTPPLMSVMHEASSEREAIAWLEKNGGGIYRNLLHGFDCEVRVKVTPNSK